MTANNKKKKAYQELHVTLNLVILIVNMILSTIQVLNAATSSNYEGKSTHIKVRSVACLNHEKVRPRSTSSAARRQRSNASETA